MVCLKYIRTPEYTFNICKQCTDIKILNINTFNRMFFQVEGDTVTFSFEMRSGREHNTPDKAMWGFSCTVRAQVLH